MLKRFIERVSKSKKPDASRNIFGLSPYKWKLVDPKEKGKRQVLYGLCRGCMQGDCATLVHLEDGIVVKTEGNPYAVATQQIENLEG